MNAFKHYSQPQQHHHSSNTLDNIIGSNDNITPVPLKRTRAKRSCDFCRKRKSRCDADASTPCANCKAWGYTCEFHTVRKKRGPPSVYVDNLEKKCKKMESLLAALTNCSIKDLERNDFQYAGHVQPASPPDQSDSSSDEEDDTDYEVYQQEKEISKDYDSIKYTGQSSAGLRLFGSDVFKLQSSIPWPGRENIVLKLMSQDELMIVRTEKSQITGKSDMLLDVGLSMRAPLFNNSTANPSVIANSAASMPRNLKKPARHQLDKMIGMYFSHLHLSLPIVNKKKFLEQYHKSSSGPPSILLQAVLALTFRFAGQNLPDFVKDAAEFGDCYFRKVMKRLRDSTRSRLCHVQAALLMVQYLDMDDGDVDSVQWCTLGSAIRMAQDLGLHRSCAKWNLPRSEIETRHRVFYACYVMDRWLGARAGKPLTILDRDFDTDMPSPYEISDDDNGSESSAQGVPTYRSFILLIKLSVILGRVLKSLYAPNAKIANSNAGLDDPTILTVFDRRLKNWKSLLNEPLDGLVLSELDKANLRLYYYAVVLLLHRPFNSLSPTKYPELQSIVADSEKACINAAKKLSSIVRQRQDQRNDPAYYFLLCSPSCFVYALFQSSLAFLSNALKTKSASDIQSLHQSIHLVKTHSDIGPASHAAEILDMLVSINGLHIDYKNSSATQDGNATPSTISPTVSPAPSNDNGTSYSRNRNDDDEIPKTVFFQQRMVNTSTVGGFTPDVQQGDLKLVMDNHQDSYMQQQGTQFQQAQQQQQQHNNYYSQNYPAYNSTNAYPHQRSFSFGQDNSPHQQQQIYSQQTRVNSHNNLENHNSSTPSNHHVAPSSTSSDSTPAGMHVNNLLASSYNTPYQSSTSVTPPQHHNNTIPMPSYTTPIPQAPQAYTAAYDPNMNVSNTTLPPSSLNWSDWDVYIGHQNQNLPFNQQQQNLSSSDHDVHYP